MKLKYTAFIILIILALDQFIKIYVKTHFYMGEDVRVLGNWFHLHFIENPGMAWGMKFGGDWGKIALTVFRLIAVIWGTFYIKKIVKAEMQRGFIICVCLIYAGAAGNLIDSIFYGKIFNVSDPYMQNIATLFPKEGGYAGFLHGRVVDMFYFPLVDTILPNWVPFMGGQRFTFFDPVFNLADMSISTGVISLLVFQSKFFPKKVENNAV
ncbi:lipoprotein signal peptidase [Rhizosphaericola mali]|uniref:Lipoprotein signal peptidase n=1 Tax=Rhizosphaericola mali TaxID=2545455 RepID=A0A5P2G405_9BACT|nr:lipoprotein signal peptidase [Rhizosphaericola mali]QES89947.1 lipoprotein signal peptidase [Rhizosphaericola mali]